MTIPCSKTARAILTILAAFSAVAAVPVVPAGDSADCEAGGDAGPSSATAASLVAPVACTGTFGPGDKVDGYGLSATVDGTLAAGKPWLRLTVAATDAGADFNLKLFVRPSAVDASPVAVPNMVAACSTRAPSGEADACSLLVPGDVRYYMEITADTGAGDYVVTAQLVEKLF